MYTELDYKNSLYHHGIKGQKWGVKNGPPYPLDENDHSAREKKENWKQSLTEQNEESSTKGGYKTNLSKDNSHVDLKSVARTLGIDESKSEELKQIATILGVSLAATAGIYAVGYVMNNGGIKSLGDYSNPGAPRIYGFNSDKRANKVFKISDALFDNQFNDDPIGQIAERNGFGFVNADSIVNSIKNAHEFIGKTVDEKEAAINNLVKDIRTEQVDYGSTRRLSCWSGSNAFFMSMLTGQKYVSRSFTNLVDFNDFDEIYKKQPTIFNLKGDTVNDFVGKFGSGLGHKSANHIDAKNLIDGIFRNISTSNNSTFDGKTTIGFINAAYHDCTCTHQWNFELSSGAVGRILNIVDTYTGARYNVATEIKLSNGGSRINYTNAGDLSGSNGFGKLVKELAHYNSDSIRFYAPSLDSIDPEIMSKIILGETGIKHSLYFVAGPNGSFLIHHGIKGMRWGVRRYQNSDGSYTFAGRKRYNDENFYKYNKKTYGKVVAKKADKLRGKGYTRRDARLTAQYGKKRAERIKKRVSKGDKLQNAELKELGRMAIKSMILSYGSVYAFYKLTDPEFDRMLVKGMKSAINWGADKKSRIRKRYNRANQLPDPKRRYVYANYTINYGD